jgi:hypothetical protein
VIGFTRHFRGLLVALAMLALSAGAVLAVRPGATPDSLPSAATGGLERAADGLKRAAEASGKTVPVAAPDQNEDADQDVDESEPAEDQAGDEQTGDEQAGTHPDNHGADVSAAAQGPTPQAFDNHGQFVRSIATANHGQETSATHATSKSKGAKPGH